MEQTIKIRCKNNKKILNISIGSTLSEIFSQTGLQMEYGPVSARVNNKVEGMHFQVYKPKDVEFLDLHSSSGLRTYTRTLFFVLCKAAHDLWKNCRVVIDIPVSNGYFVDIERKDDNGKKIEVGPDDVHELQRRMQEIIDADLPIHRYETKTEEAIKMFREAGSLSKAPDGFIPFTMISTAMWTITMAPCSPLQVSCTSSA